MKIHFTLFFLLLICTVFGQRDPTRYTIDYSLNQSNRFDNEGHYFEAALSHNVFIKTELASARSSRFTLGMGFLRSHIIGRDYSGQNGYKDQEIHSYIDYLVFPGGIKFSFGSLYIHPEIAATYNYSLTFNSFLVDENMNRIDGSENHYSSQRYFEVLFASLMTIGYEIKIGSISVLTGTKGYLAFNNNYVNTFGIGLMVGLKI